MKRFSDIIELVMLILSYIAVCVSVILIGAEVLNTFVGLSILIASSFIGLLSFMLLCTKNIKKE